MDEHLPEHKILMIGTDTNAYGGIASVVREYEAAGLFEKWPIRYVATHQDGTRFRKLITAACAFFTYLRLLWSAKVRVVHVHGASRSSFWRKSWFLMAASILNKNTIFHLHGAEFDKFYWVECGRIRKTIVRAILAHCSTIIVLSDSWREIVYKITSHEKIVVIKNFVAVASGPLKRSEFFREAVILFLGRLERRKGVYDLLEAVAALDRDGSGWTLLLAGDGELDNVYARAVELGIDSRVKVLGWVNEQEKRELLDESTVFCLPSYAEGLPMALLEAMAQGIAIVTTPVGGIGEVVRHETEGLLIQPGDVVALHDALKRLLMDREARCEFGERAKSRIDQEFSATASVKKLGELYKSFGIDPWISTP